MKNHLFFIAAAIAAVLFSAPATGQPILCLPGDLLTDKLRSHAEVAIWRGISQNNLLRLFLNEATGMWTFVLTSPLGFSCIVAHGKDGDQIAAEKATPAYEAAPIPEGD